MKKLIRGILDFRKHVLPGRRETFAQLARGQSPDALFVTCSDSRVAPNWFASTDPGDLFVVRNVGNLVPPCGGEDGRSAADESEAAAIEFAILNLGISDIIVCGHSECGAMQALLRGRENVPTPNLRAWLRHGEKALARMKGEKSLADSLPVHNRLSQLNVLQQLEHLKSYPVVQKGLATRELRVHGWWFELARGVVHCFEPASGTFAEIDEANADRILESL